MILKTIKHKGVRRLVEAYDRSGLPAAYCERINKILAFLRGCKDANELTDFPLWNIHQLKGDRYPSWSISVSRNYRITFFINEANEIEDIDYEDYH